jgi:hypothetical protein
MWVDILKVTIPSVFGLLTAIVTILLNRSNVSLNKAKGTTDKSLNRDVEVYRLLYPLREKYGAMRVYIKLFHNGGTYFSGEHKKKITMHYHAEGPGVKDISDDFQDRLVKGQLFRLVDELRKNNDQLYRDNRELVECAETREQMSLYDIQASFHVMMRDNDKDPIGMLAITFDRIDPLSSVDRAAIVEASHKIKRLLLI